MILMLLINLFVLKQNSEHLGNKVVLSLTDGLLTNVGLNFFINPVNDLCEVSENFQVNGLLYFTERFSINRRINLFLDFAVGPSDHMTSFIT